MAKDETSVTQERVWNEHLEEVHVGAHWAYLAVVLIGGFLLMVALIAFLGGTQA
jgi:hypothetical protein